MHFKQLVYTSYLLFLLSSTSNNGVGVVVYGEKYSVGSKLRATRMLKESNKRYGRGMEENEKNRLLVRCGCAL